MTHPSVQDLGVFSDPLLLFGGVYGNLEAFAALADKAREMGIAPDRMIHTGDVAAYCADSFACADRLRTLGCPAMAHATIACLDRAHPERRFPNEHTRVRRADGHSRPRQACCRRGERDR